MSATIPIEPRSAPHDSQRASAELPVDEHPRPPAVSVWAMVIVVLPFLAIPGAHLVSNPETATGFFHYELPYYVANGRAALERGNGLLYPNPFDPSADAPAIYAHWLPEMLGVFTSALGVDPGTLIVWMAVAAAILLTLMTQRLLQGCLPEGFLHQTWALFAAMWGGGSLVVVGGLVSLFSAETQFDVLCLDPGHGMWFLNWGRNSLFPTEAIYHALCAGCWLAEIRQRRFTANTFLLLLATTHPWSGLELLLTINLWRGIQVAIRRDRNRVLHFGFAVGVLVLFLSYYKIWLPSFEQHAELQSVWELDWSLAWSSAIPAWGIVAVAAGWRLWTRPDDLRTVTVQFLLCALTVAVGLSLHDRIIKPVQPLHFTRGYVWMPLFLLGAPVLLTSVYQLWHRSFGMKAVAVGLALLFVADNLSFAIIQCGRQYRQEDGFHLDLHDRALLADLHERYPSLTVLTDSETVNYLLPAYANLRPWLGHQFNTPEFVQRKAVMQECFPAGTVAPERIPSDVTLLVINRSRNGQSLALSEQWLPSAIPNAKWSVWIRHTTAADAENPH